MLILGAILVVLVIVGLIFLYFMYITNPPKQKSASGNGIDKGQVSTKWGEVQEMMKVGGPANYKQSIFEADKLVDSVLRSKVKGETMGERLKGAKHLFSEDTYEGLWVAHKIRNKVAHEADFEGLSSDAVLAVRKFEKALKELRAI